MVNNSYVLLNVTKTDKNGYLFTKELWDSVISSERNQNKIIPVLKHIDPEADLTAIPMDKTIGVAQLSWFDNDIMVQSCLSDETYVGTRFMPSFRVEPEDITVVDGKTVISKGYLNCLFVSEAPAIGLDTREFI